MTFKHTVIANKPWLQTESIGFSPAGIIAKLKNIVNQYAPVCYQDENGFHTGVKSAEKEIKWPMVW
jgi:hypothetical protein